MLDKIKSLFSAIGEASDDGPSTFTATDPRVAAGALMYHVVQADGVIRPVETEKLSAILADEYDLRSKDLQELLNASRLADSEAVDLYRFTSILMRHFSRQQCVSFVELLWEIVYADGVRHELEDNVVWRISELLGVSGRDRVLMRQQVQARMGMKDVAGDDG